MDEKNNATKMFLFSVLECVKRDITKMGLGKYVVNVYANIAGIGNTYQMRSQVVDTGTAMLFFP